MWFVKLKEKLVVPS